ncbi:MAG: hypothetical protein VX228_16940, partial [Pseudomonadota bacterium]|nr:hypothetical protein [Pseudomonadota bacterium]
VLPRREEVLAGQGTFITVEAQQRVDHGVRETPLLRGLQQRGVARDALHREVSVCLRLQLPLLLSSQGESKEVTCVVSKLYQGSYAMKVGLPHDAYAAQSLHRYAELVEGHTALALGVAGDSESTPGVAGVGLVAAGGGGAAAAAGVSTTAAP